MFLTNSRHRLIYLCLTGMEMGWITPLLFLLYRPLRAWQPLLMFALFFLGLLLWILTIELLSRLILRSPQYELAVVGIIGLSSGLLVRILLYPDRGLFNLIWIFDSLRSAANFEAGVPPELVVVALNFFFWLRATNASSREIDFWNVGLSFRVGMLLLIIGGGVLHQVSDINALSFLWVFFTFGLTAIALTRIDEKSIDSRSAGRLLPTKQLLQLLAMVTLTVALTVWLSRLYSPENLRAVFRWLTPLWVVLGQIFLFLMSIIFSLIGPLLLWFGELIVSLFQGIDLSGLSAALDSFREALGAAAENQRESPFSLTVPPWVWLLIRYLVLGVLLLLFLGLILIFLDRIKRRRVTGESEAETSEDITFGGDALREGAAWLKDTLGLVRHYGLSRQLLAAISVENIYANLCRMARKAGYPRPAAQPPDDYLPTLAHVFIDQEGSLSRITAGYMRVHYGGRALSAGELSQLRADYEQVRHASRRQKE